MRPKTGINLLGASMRHVPGRHRASAALCSRAAAEIRASAHCHPTFWQGSLGVPFRIFQKLQFPGGFKRNCKERHLRIKSVGYAGLGSRPKIVGRSRTQGEGVLGVILTRREPVRHSQRSPCLAPAAYQLTRRDLIGSSIRVCSTIYLADDWNPESHLRSLASQIACYLSPLSASLLNV